MPDLQSLRAQLASLECPYPGIVQFREGFECAKAMMMAVIDRQSVIDKLEFVSDEDLEAWARESKAKAISVQAIPISERSQAAISRALQLGKEAMNSPTQPTDEGKRRYEPDGYYNANWQPGTPCTCKPECDDPCKGECGCQACCEAYGDYLSTPDE